MTARTKYIVGVDLGGTNIVAGALAEDGSDIIALRTEATRADQGADAVVDRIARMIDTVIAETIAQTGASTCAVRRSDNLPRRDISSAKVSPSSSSITR